jgi:hypothetical protein
MKIVDSNNWAPRYKLNLPMPADLQVYFAYSREVASFYYRLGHIVDKYIFYEDIYNILYEDGYFDEDN